MADIVHAPVGRSCINNLPIFHYSIQAYTPPPFPFPFPSLPWCTARQDTRLYTLTHPSDRGKMHVGGVHEVTTPPPVPAQPPAPWGYNGGHGDTTPVQVHGHGQGQGQGSIPQPCLHGQDETLTVERLLLPRRIELPEEWRERVWQRCWCLLWVRSGECLII